MLNNSANKDALLSRLDSDGLSLPQEKRENQSYCRIPFYQSSQEIKDQLEAKRLALPKTNISSMEFSISHIGED